MTRRRKVRPPRLGASSASDRAPVAATELRLSEEVARLAAVLGERPVCLREVITILRGRAYTLLLIILALPFCTPIPLPGLSTAFGLMIALIGFRLSLRQKPWLPRRLLDTTLPARFLSGALTATRRLVRFLEYFLKPRWTGLLDRRVLHHAYGAAITVSGLLLLLPLPIPFTNLLPALTVILFASALLERDGYFVVAGAVAMAVSLVVFIALFWGGAEVAGWIKEHFSGMFQPDYEIAP